MCLAQSSVIHSSNLAKQTLIKEVLGAQQCVGVLYAERSPGSEIQSLYSTSEAGSRVETHTYPTSTKARMIWKCVEGALTSFLEGL